MLEKLIRFIKRFFVRASTSQLPYSNEHYDQEIEERSRSLELFYKEVGENPLNQIDWIIENSLEEYNRKQEYYMSGKYKEEFTEECRDINIEHRKIERSCEGVADVSVIAIAYIPSKEFHYFNEESRSFNKTITPETKIGFGLGTTEEKEKFRISLEDATRFHDAIDREYDRIVTESIENVIRGGIGNKDLYTIHEVREIKQSTLNDN